ncbi:acyl carrier protein [Saccharothrix texasensis]|uniref:Acyl carrier protein n=1 Tax=Saccharothrix texasensis TaxID=103734 RepID=A0A3N1GX90_9PSEU|nr:acyl carrier protein [Saccharothrix texasensis]ROP34951.1 acyl carrier protein [Saccharothrix texasensis]
MDRQTVIVAVQAALSEVLERDVSGTSAGTKLFDELHLDSTSVLELLMALEDAVGISVDPENLDLDDFESIGTLADYVLAQHTPAGA